MAGEIPSPPSGIDTAKIEMAVRLILEALGEDPQRPGLIDTPRRVAAAYAELCAGMYEKVERHLEVYFQENHDELVLVRDIPFYSLCEHHLLPFYGKAHIAYIPQDGRVTGLSKLARVVEGFARRLQMQERMTAQIADTLMEHLKPLGVAVVLEAEHLCMTMRGIRKPGSVTVTSAVRGTCRTDEKTRAEVLALIQGHRISR
ncbi:MAG TPA: GTP cyclohydrolase I FolE [Limnochordales bacterium]